MTTTDEGFAEYLAQYRVKLQKKYIPPFRINRLRREYEGTQQSRLRTQQKIGQNEEDAKEEVISAVEGSVLDLYSKHSSTFNEWRNVYLNARDNPYLAAFYEGSYVSISAYIAITVQRALLSNTKRARK